MKMADPTPVRLKCLLEMSSKETNIGSMITDLVQHINNSSSGNPDQMRNLVNDFEMLSSLVESAFSSEQFVTENANSLENGDAYDRNFGTERKKDLLILIGKKCMIPFVKGISLGKIQSYVLQKCWSSVISIVLQLSNESDFVEGLVNVLFESLKLNSTNSNLSHHSEQDLEESFHMMLHLEMLIKVLQKTSHKFPWYLHMEKELLSEVARAMQIANDKVVGRILSLLLPVIIGDNVSESNIVTLWTAIQTCHIEHGYTSVSETPRVLSERPIFLMCGIADIFFPPSGFSSAVIKLLQGAEFWDILQSGFFHPSSLTRKRTLYLLKRLLDIIETQNIDLPVTSSDGQLSRFWWSASKKKQLSDLWMNYIFIVETLEEKQIHVLRPLLPRFELLIQASNCSNSDENSEPALIHTSWLLCMIQRAASHDNNHIQRWIVQQVLILDYSKCPIFSQHQTQFFYGPLMKMLSVSSLYHRPQGALLGECPPIADALGRFFNNLSDTLEQNTKVSFFIGFIRGTLSQVWSGGPLVFVARGLAQVKTGAVIPEELIPEIRELLTSMLLTVESTFRSAIQYYIMMFVTRFIDRASVSVSSFCSLLACLRPRECWQRGTHFYNKLVSFMVDGADGVPHWNAEDVRLHLITTIKNYMKKTTSSEEKSESHDFVRLQCTQVIRLLVLVYDGHLLHTDENRSMKADLQTLLTPVLFDVLLTMNTHAYMSRDRAHRAICFFSVFLQESRSIASEDQGLGAEVGKIVDLCAGEVLLFIQRQIAELAEKTALPSIELYCDVLQMLTTSLFWGKMRTLTHMTSLVQMCTNIARKGIKDDRSSTLLPMYGSVRVLGAICSSLPDHKDSWALPWMKEIQALCQSWKIIQKLPKPNDLHSGIGSESHSYDKLAYWGKVASSFLSAQWTYLYAHLQNKYDESPSDDHSYHGDIISLSDCLLSLDLMSSADVIPVLKCMKFIIRGEAEEDQSHAIDVSWHKILEALKDSCFWASYEAFLDVAFHDDILSKGPDCHIGQYITQLLEELFTLGEEKGGIVFHVVRRLCVWAKTSDDAAKHAIKYIDTYITALMFGPVHSRGKRFINEVVQFVFGQEELPGNQILDILSKADCMARVQVISLLAALDPKNPAQKLFLYAFLRKLISKYRMLLEQTTFRNYLNSLPHRHKHRLFAAILVLFPVVDESILPEVFQFQQQMLVMENQPSLRCMAEWLIILLINRWSHLMEPLWTELCKGSEKKAAYLCSLLCVIAHVSKLVQGKQNQIDFLDRGLREVLPWCMAHHFNIRVFAQATILTLWEIAKKNQLDSIITKHSIVDSFVNFTDINRSACKNTFKLLDNFFFKFDPIRDYSIESIVRTLPMLASMTDEEWISPTMFTEVDPGWQHKTYTLPLYNISQDLSLCQPGMWKVKYCAREVETPGEENLTGDVQKKMIPWRVMLPETELDTDLLEDYSKKKHKAGGMILVTSLVDKIPNLGGLCRTAEIFGVSEFVIGNLSFVQDKGFQGLSVSAHKWIPIKEVLCHLLKNYMLEMKAEGYTLVGAEQTAQSHCLTDYIFPKKTLLLLGNEKEGIPVELIQLLDACVEIPQQGIIRSLNVHVSGALLVWEYTRQQLHKDS